MISGFWGKLKKPILASASMANITDAAFRQMLVKYGRPDVIWTEFVSCDGLYSKGKEKLLVDLRFGKKEKPVVAQFFGAKPENFYKCALLAQELGFDGIDINMGCPDKSVERQGAGAALIKNSELAKKIIKETKRGAGKLPVSVKTRIGYDKNIFKKWLPLLLEEEPAVITIHGRTRKELSLVPAHWDVIKEAVDIVKKYDSSRKRTLILGNGDIKDLADAAEKIKMSGADGVMVGRALIGNPWFFNKRKQKTGVTIKEKLSAMLEHIVLFEKIFEGEKSFDNTKKHIKAYISGFDGAKEIRVKLMAVKNAAAAKEIVGNYLLKF